MTHSTSNASKRHEHSLVKYLRKDEKDDVRIPFVSVNEHALISNGLGYYLDKHEDFFKSFLGKLAGKTVTADAIVGTWKTAQKENMMSLQQMSYLDNKVFDRVVDSIVNGHYVSEHAKEIMAIRFGSVHDRFVKE